MSNPGILVLEKDGFVLALAYRTEHASGIVGGKFSEAFRIPWLDPDQTICGDSLTLIPQPASRMLMFMNLVIDTGSVNVRKNCGITSPLATSFSPFEAGNQETDQKWFGGFFSSGGHGWFLGETTDSFTGSCKAKLYSLTTSAVHPEQLPQPSDPHLQSIIRESIDIAGSIRYKRCAPERGTPF